jgi:hypothetical protein
VTFPTKQPTGSRTSIAMGCLTLAAVARTVAVIVVAAVDVPVAAVIADAEVVADVRAGAAVVDAAVPAVDMVGRDTETAGVTDETRLNYAGRDDIAAFSTGLGACFPPEVSALGFARRAQLLSESNPLAASNNSFRPGYCSQAEASPRLALALISRR